MMAAKAATTADGEPREVIELRSGRDFVEILDMEQEHGRG